jgi:hypothetical protein
MLVCVWLIDGIRINDRIYCTLIIHYMTHYVFSSHHFRLPFQETPPIPILSHRVRVALRLAVYRQSVYLRAKPLETHDQYFFFNWILAVIVLMQHPLWREDGSFVYNCFWPSPAQSFSGPSPVGVSPSLILNIAVSEQCTSIYAFRTIITIKTLTAWVFVIKTWRVFCVVAQASCLEL